MCTAGGRGGNSVGLSEGPADGSVGLGPVVGEVRPVVGELGPVVDAVVGRGRGRRVRRRRALRAGREQDRDRRR